MSDDRINKIVDNVSKLFLDYGIRGVTMDDIAHRLAMSKKTLYEFFNDKKELVEAVLNRARCEMEDHFNGMKESKLNAMEELFHFYELQIQMIRSNKPAFLYDLKKYYPDLYGKFQGFKHEAIYNNVISNLKKGIEEGLYRKDINPDIIARNSLMRMECMMNSDIFSPEEFMSTEVFSEIFKYHLYGITSDSGREMIKKKFNTTNS